jgi:regulator of replication initiation timing
MNYITTLQERVEALEEELESVKQDNADLRYELSHLQAESPKIITPVVAPPPVRTAKLVKGVWSW